MAQTTFAQELDAHCAALLALLDEAHVLYLRTPGGDTGDPWVFLRPTLQVWQVPQHRQRRIEQELRKNAQLYTLCVCQPTDSGRWFAALPLHRLAMFIDFARHPGCTTYRLWQLQVHCAFLKHGHYDPATNHTPPPGQELDALEARERGRDLFNEFVPGFGDALSGQRPTTEEGRRLLWHRVIDPETGEETWVNDADIPDEEEDDDAND
jgi:hypothetical protein